MRMITTTIGSLCAALLLTAATAEAGKTLDSLEGTSWAIHVETGEKSDARGEKSFEEIVTFRAGQAVLTTVAARGYSAAPLVAKKDGSRWDVSFDHASDSDGLMHWEGDIREEHFKGIMLWTRKDGKVRNFWFKGKLVVAGKKK